MTEKLSECLRIRGMSWDNVPIETLIPEVEALEAEVKTLTKRVERQDQLLNPTLETRVDIHGLEEQISELKDKLAKAQDYPEKLRQALLMEGYSETVVKMLRELEKALEG